MSTDEPTDEMPGGPEDPTEVTRPEDEATGRIPEGNENPTETLGDPGEERSAPSEGGEAPTEAIPPSGNEPTEVRPPAGAGKRGIAVLIASIVASLLLVGAYVAAGGPVGPDQAADPCDPRPWTDPGNVEEAAQQFALSAADGAACELGVSREELARSIPEEGTREQFMERHGFTDSDLENALRAGLNRAVDDAENAGALGGLAATGIRAAIRIMPMSVMIGLLENADSIFGSGGLGTLGGIGDAIDSIGGGLGDLPSGTTDDPLGSIGKAIEEALPEGTTDALDELLLEEARRQLEDQAKDRLEQGLEDLIAP